MGKSHARSGLCHITVRDEVWFLHKKWLLLEEQSSMAFLLPGPPLLRGVWGINTHSVMLLRCLSLSQLLTDSSFLRDLLVLELCDGSWSM